MRELQGQDYEMRQRTTDPTSDSIVRGVSFQANHFTRTHGSGAILGARLRILLDNSHNSTLNTVASFDGAYKCKVFIDASQNMLWTIYESGHLPTMGTKLTFYNLNRTQSNSCDISCNLLGSFATTTETSGNSIMTGFIRTASQYAMSSITEKEFIMSPTKKYLLDVQNSGTATSVTGIRIVVTREPKTPTA